MSYSQRVLLSSSPQCAPTVQVYRFVPIGARNPLTEWHLVLRFEYPCSGVTLEYVERDPSAYSYESWELALNSRDARDAEDKPLYVDGPHLYLYAEGDVDLEVKVKVEHVRAPLETALAVLVAEGFLRRETLPGAPATPSDS